MCVCARDLKSCLDAAGHVGDCYLLAIVYRFVYSSMFCDHYLTTMTTIATTSHCCKRLCGSVVQCFASNKVKGRASV